MAQRAGHSGDKPQLIGLARRRAFETYVRFGRLPDERPRPAERKAIDPSAATPTRRKATRYYVWRTREDDRVRATHAIRHGQIFAWADAPPGGHPGTEPNCRCWAEPYYGDPAVPDALQPLHHNYQTDATGTAPWAIIETLTRSDGSMAQSVVVTRDGTQIHSQFAGTMISRQVALATGKTVRVDTSAGVQLVYLGDDRRPLFQSAWTAKGPKVLRSAKTERDCRPLGNELSSGDNFHHPGASGAMTTIAEVKRWTHPILAEHPDLALKPRMLYVRPVHHIFLTIMFVGASDRTLPRPRANHRLLFAPPSARSSDNWSRELMAGWSTDPDFADRLARVIRESLANTLRPRGSIEGLYAAMGSSAKDWGYELGRLSHAGILHAVVLAALGRLAESCAVAQAHVDNNEGPLLESLARQMDRATRGRRHERASALSGAKFNRYFLGPMDELRQLVVVTRANDRQAVAALLHQWEHERVQRLGVEDAWEPTPFPLELGLGDRP